MSEWITDRLPERNDADRVGLVWCTDLDGKVVVTEWNAFSFDTSKAWMHRELPKPYVAPIDTSLSASIERVFKRNSHGMACPELANQKAVCGVCDINRIIDAAKLVAKRTAYAREIRKDDNSVSAALERHKKRMEHLTDGRDPLSFAVSMADCDLTDNCTCELCDDRRVQEAAKKEVLRQATKDYMEAVTPSCGPSQGSEPGASGSNDPTPFAGSSHSVGEAELPDPGEDEKKPDRSFPWPCVCGKEGIMPDGLTLTCRQCGTQWANSYDEDGKFGRPSVYNGKSAEEWYRLFAQEVGRGIKLRRAAEASLSAWILLLESEGPSDSIQKRIDELTAAIAIWHS